MEVEIPLSGGRVTSGVVRVGSTVRRPLGTNSPLRHELLRHLEAVGFGAAPRLLGIDARGREILTYIEGSVPPDLGAFSVPQIRAAARLIAEFHEATASSPIRGDGEVICHGDLTPCNFVFQSDLPIAIIDFDACHRGRRHLDVGYAAWSWLDVGNPDGEPLATGRRLAAFLEAYGLSAPPDPVAALCEAQAALIERCTSSGRATPVEVGAERWARQSRAWVWQHAQQLEAGLGNLRGARPRRGQDPEGHLK